MQRKLVEHPKDWPWSSWCHYAKGEEGVIRIDVLDGSASGAESKVKSRTLEKHKSAAPEFNFQKNPETPGALI